MGAAPGVPLTGVKVLGCDGSGTLTTILKGIDWVTANAMKPAIANMSLSGPTSQTLDDAVRKSASSGVFYSIANGNSGAKAYDYLPARVGAGTNRSKSGSSIMREYVGGFYYSPKFVCRIVHILGLIGSETPNDPAWHRT